MMGTVYYQILAIFQVPVEQITVEMGIVFGIVLIALLLFVIEPLPIDVTALTILVLLVILGPWTGITVEQSISGFSNPATITVLAMFVLSDGLRRTGIVRAVGLRIIAFTGDNERRQLAATIGIAGSVAGFVNNTPVVATMIPMVIDIAERTGTSPSKLLIPLSYAAMLGGMLTLIGTSPNLIASDLSRRLLDQPFSMFEFTILGVILLVTGGLYLLTVGRYLIPERIQAGTDPIDRFDLGEYLAELVVPDGSTLDGNTVASVTAGPADNVNIVRIIRNGRVLSEPLDKTVIRSGDVLLTKSDRRSLLDFVDARDIEFPRQEGELLEPDETRHLVELIVLPDTPIVGRSLSVHRFRQRYDASVLAIRRGGRLLEQPLAEVTLRGGDALLVQVGDSALERLSNNRSFVVAEELEYTDFRTEKSLYVIGILIGVVGVAALGVLSIVTAALGGIVAMVATGCIRADEMYDAVDWNVIFLLAGIIPLGIALEQTGGAELLALLIVPAAEYVPILAFLWLFYMLTTLITEIITNIASVVLMAPIAVDVAFQIGADPFSFMLLVAFASSTSLMTPIGYQTNLMVFNRGGYRFVDFLRVGIPLQLLLGAVTALGIAIIWGV